jgi:FkbM family methyltransferase
VGSNDGVTLSNTRQLALTGWRGVMVEPSPEAFIRLKENYKDIINCQRIGDSKYYTNCFYLYNFALGTHNGMMKFYDSGSHLKNGDIGLLSTGSEEDYNKWRPTTEFKEIEVKVFRWKTFLNRVKFKEFDFISIDAESFDLAILKQIDLRSTSCVCVEWNNKQELKNEFDKLMIGFKIIYTSLENLIYAR